VADDESVRPVVFSSGRGRDEAVRRVEAEIVREKAEVLGRAGERLERALGEVRDAARRLEAARDVGGETRAAREREYDEARRRGLAARRTLLIQREAIGLRNHRIVDQEFPEPRPRREHGSVE
jgi:hypothetical protein